MFLIGGVAHEIIFTRWRSSVLKVLNKHMSAIRWRCCHSTTIPDKILFKNPEASPSDSFVASNQANCAPCVRFKVPFSSAVSLKLSKLPYIVPKSVLWSTWHVHICITHNERQKMLGTNVLRTSINSFLHRQQGRLKIEHVSLPPVPFLVDFNFDALFPRY